MADDCLFCKIAAGELPSTEVYSDDTYYAFRDINPATPVHILIVPRKHIARIDEASEEDAEVIGTLFLKANEIARSEGIAETGFRLIINCGLQAGQSVFHIHLHIMGGRPMAWPPS